MVDHRYGAWYRLLDGDNRKYNDEKSPAGKTDYHTMGLVMRCSMLSGRSRSDMPQKGGLP